jgi:hypothetical protein
MGATYTNAAGWYSVGMDEISTTALEEPALPAPLRDRILERLGLSRLPSPDFEGLCELYGAWCGRVSFDNVRKVVALQTGRDLPGRTAEEFFEAWLDLGAAGTCWPGSNALYASGPERRFRRETERRIRARPGSDQPRDQSGRDRRPDLARGQLDAHRRSSSTHRYASHRVRTFRGPRSSRRPEAISYGSISRRRARFRSGSCRTRSRTRFTWTATSGRGRRARSTGSSTRGETIPARSES